jgi:hypothetical protein
VILVLRKRRPYARRSEEIEEAALTAGVRRVEAKKTTVERTALT